MLIWKAVPDILLIKKGDVGKLLNNLQSTILYLRKYSSCIRDRVQLYTEVHTQFQMQREMYGKICTKQMIGVLSGKRDGTGNR